MKLNEEQAEVFLSDLWGKYKCYKEQVERLSESAKTNAEKHKQEISRFQSGIFERDRQIRELNEKIELLETKERQANVTKETIAERAKDIVENLEKQIAEKDAIRKEQDEIISGLKVQVSALKSQVSELELMKKNLATKSVRVKDELERGYENTVDLGKAKKEITSLKLSNIRLREKVEYAEMEGIKFPPMPEMQRIVKEKRATIPTANVLHNESVTNGNYAEESESNIEEKDETTSQVDVEVPQGCNKIDCSIKTPCPFGVKGFRNRVIDLGSSQCAKCPWCKGVYKDINIVVCSKKPLTDKN